MRVMLVQDNPKYRRVIESALVDDCDVELVSHFATFERAVQNLEAQAQNVDIILLDLNLPGMNELDRIHILQTVSHQAAIVVIAQSAGDANIMRAFTSGAGGYLLESDTIKRISKAVRAVADGGMLVDSSILHLIAQSLGSSIPGHL